MNRIMALLCACVLIAHAADSQVGRSFEIDNGLLKLVLDLNSKTWSLFERHGEVWKPVIASATLSLAFHDRDSLILSNEPTQAFAKTDQFSDEIGKGRIVNVRLDGQETRWAMTFVLYDNKKTLTLSASAGNESPNDWKPDRFHLLDVGGAGYLGFDTANLLMHVNGYQSRSNSGIVRLDSVNRNTSYWSTVFSEPDLYYSLLVGFLTNSQATNFISTEPIRMETGQLQLSSTSDLRSLVIPPGGEFRSDRIIIQFDPSPLDNLERFGDYLQMFAPAVNKPFTPTGREPANKPGSLRVPGGWSSRYSYYQHITEDSILENLNAAAKDFKEAGLRFIQIDDGYQIAAGDWNTNEQFPHGHQWLVNQIHRKGFLAGLWVAPFAVAESSSVYKEHRDWLLRDAGDNLKQFHAIDWRGGRIFCLDPTRPEVQLWLENLFYKITNAWGYDYVKIDFLYFPADGGEYFRSVTPAQAYRMGLQSIRRGAGSDKFILGCGAPIGSSIGYVDGMRIGNDVSAGWGGITPAVNAAASRWFYHRTVWYDDPDCLFVRDSLTIDQARAWAAVVSLSGQMDFLSDKLTLLPDDRRSLLKMTLPVYGAAATPVDLFSEPGLPTIWNLAVRKEFEKWNVVGVFNWSNDASGVTIRASRLGLPPGKTYLAYERWSDRYLGEFRESLSLKLGPMSSQILSVHEKPDHPFVLSTSRHITQGAVDLASEEWSTKTRTLSAVSGNLIEGTYSVLVYIPADFEFKGVLSASKPDTARISSDVIKLSFPVGRKTSLSWKVTFR